jgi:hypothetical protein
MQNREIHKGIEACAKTIARRKALVKNVTIAITWTTIPFFWLFPFDVYKDVALTYAILMSILLACQGIEARKGHPPVSLRMIFAFIAFLYMGCMIMLYQVVLWPWIVQGSTAIAFGFLSELHGPNSREQRLFNEAAQHIEQFAWKMKALGNAEVNKENIEELCRDLYWIEAAAWRAGADIRYRLESGREALSNLEVRCSIIDAIRTDGAISFNKLCAVSSLPTERFAPLLLDMCRQLNLSTDGNVVKANDDQDAIDLLKEIEGYFGKWREVEASKLGKV